MPLALVYSISGSVFVQCDSFKSLSRSFKSCMLGRKVIYVRCINYSYNNVAKGIGLLDKKHFLFIQQTVCASKSFRKIYPLKVLINLLIHLIYSLRRHCNSGPTCRSILHRLCDKIIYHIHLSETIFNFPYKPCGSSSAASEEAADQELYCLPYSIIIMSCYLVCLISD